MIVHLTTSTMRLQLLSAFLYLSAFSFLTCERSGSAPDYDLGNLGAFAEAVHAGAKRMALSRPMTSGEMDAFLPAAREVAERNGVMVYREDQLIHTDLFPQDVAQNKEVLILYRGTALDEYLALKKDIETMQAEGRYSASEREAAARRFGRLLGYSPQGINRLLADQTDFRTMRDFGIRGGNVFLYYRDLPAAVNFYEKTLGLKKVTDYGMAATLQVGRDAFITLVDAAEGMHSADEPKTVALALLTDQLEDWWAYLNARQVTIKYPLKVREGSAHDGFVAVDPEGYLLEFERFHQHPENERFMPWLDRAPVIATAVARETTGEMLGFKGVVTWLYYRDVLGMQGFYEEKLGLDLVADQGWTKIYRLSATNFIGLVDEARGMHDFTEEKAVTLSFLLEDVQGWFDYVQEKGTFPLRSEQLEKEPSGKYEAFVGYDPAGYYMEFDRFLEHPANAQFLPLLSAPED